MRKKFTLNSLQNSTAFYEPINTKLFYSLYYYTKNNPKYLDLNHRLELGGSEWDYLILNIKALNRSFVKLLEVSEPVAALALIRLQTDNLKHLYAETKYFNCVLYKVYESGLNLNQIKVGGKQINPTELIAELDDKYGDVRRIWKEYCCYVHPSKEGIENGLVRYYSFMDGTEKMPKKYIKQLSKDMVYINQLIVNLLIEVINK